jgi:acetylornithine deacetylase
MAHTNELVDLLAHLVGIDSVNPDLITGGAGEGAVAQAIATWAHANGLEVTLQETAPGRPNVIVTARGTGAGKSLMLNGHTDVVGTGAMPQPFSPRIMHGRMYGRGAYDMKCGLAASLIAAKRAQALQLAGDVIVTCVTDEEVASIGSQAIVRDIERWRPDAVIVTEPTEMQAVIAHKGFAWFDIVTHGVAAHGSRPELGDDAIVKMGPVLTALDALARALPTRPAHPLLGTGSVHASLIRGGREMSSYPADCVLSLERRTLPGETKIDVFNDIAALAAHAPGATVTPGLRREPFGIAADAPLVRLLLSVAGDLTGTVPALAGVPYWADAALFASAGIPTVIFGPTGAGAHADEEWVDLASVEACAAIYLGVAQRLCR